MLRFGERGAGVAAQGAEVGSALHNNDGFGTRVGRDAEAIAHATVQRVCAVDDRGSGFRLRSEPCGTIGLLRREEVLLPRKTGGDSKNGSAGETVSPKQVVLGVEAACDAVAAPPLAASQNIGVRGEPLDRLGASRLLLELDPGGDAVLVHLIEAAGDAQAAFLKRIDQNILSVVRGGKLAGSEIAGGEQGAVADAEAKR